MRSQRQVSREATRGISVMSAEESRAGLFHISQECRSQLLSMSVATADRLLRSQRTLGQRGLTTTRAGTLLTQQIPIRTYQEWNETQPGYLKADLVAHCGADIEGGYLYTLTLTDVATGWTECLPLLYRSQETVLAAIRRARTLFPFPSGILPAQKQHELNAVAQALAPLRLFHQLEKLQKAMFWCAVEGNPFVSNAPSLPIRVFSVELCITELVPCRVECPRSLRRTPRLYQEQEKRKRALGWRRTQKDSFEGEGADRFLVESQP